MFVMRKLMICYKKLLFCCWEIFECTIKCAIESRKSLNYQMMTRPL